MTTTGPVTAPMQRFPAEPASVPAARHFVRDVLAQQSPDVVDTAELLVSELVTNALLHAQTDIEVRAWIAGPRIHVRVSDLEPRRRLLPRQRSYEASTGRGLELVEALASCYGVDRTESGKTVWFELWPDMTEPIPVPVSSWPDSLRSGAPLRRVELIDLPIAVYQAAQQHRDALLRECKLAAFAGELLGVSRAELLTADAANQLISAAVLTSLGARWGESGHCSLSIELPLDTGTDARQLMDVLDRLNEAAGAGRLLTRPALPEISLVRRWLLREIADQLSGDHPKPWSSPGEEPGPGSALLRLAEWDPSEMHASTVAMVAADDGNRIIAANAAAEELLGWETGVLVGQRITTLIPPEWRERHVAGFTSLLLTGESRIIGRHVSVTALRYDGSLLPVDLLIQAQQATDGRTVFVATLAAIS